MRKILLLTTTTILLSISPLSGQQGGKIASTVHNLSVSGPGDIKAVEETRICRFCHIPHNTQAPEALWSQKISRAEYRTPRISNGRTTRVQAPQPNGSSRLCLSCHDGTIALGDLTGEARVIPMQGTQRLLPGRRGHIGTDLSGSHPVSFVMPDSDLNIQDTAQDIGLKPLGVVMSGQTVRLDKAGRIQCTTCHDPHDDSYYQPGQTPRFWVAPTVDEVCMTCHALR